MDGVLTITILAGTAWLLLVLWIIFDGDRRTAR